MPKKLTADMILTLSKPFNATEVKEALFSINPLGSPSPYGFLAGFYNAHWTTIGPRVTSVVLKALNNGQ